MQKYSIGLRTERVVFIIQNQYGVFQTMSVVKASGIGSGSYRRIRITNQIAESIGDNANEYLPYQLSMVV